jgi:hypothetical protein
MERPKDIVVILREALLMNGLRNFTDLGQLRQKTIEKKLTENRPKLSANHLASIYLLWLRHGSAARMETDTEIDNSVKAIFHFLEPKGCKWSQIKAIWKDCMETVTKETKPQRHRLVIVNRSMTACLKDLKHRERAATSDYPSLDGPYSEPRRKPSSIFKRGTSLSPVIQTVNPPLTAPRTEPPLAQLNRLHNRQRPVIIDLTQESWKEVEPAMTRPFFKENHPPRMLVEPICLPWEAVQPSEGRLSPWDDVRQK